MGEFLDSSLTPRARRMAEWLCCLSVRVLDRRTKAALVDMLLRELPDHFTAEELTRWSHEILAQLGERQSRRAWITAAGWLVGEQERLPERPPQRMTDHARFVTQQRVRELLAKLSTPAAAVRLAR